MEERVVELAVCCISDPSFRVWVIPGLFLLISLLIAIRSAFSGGVDKNLDI